MQQRFDPMGFGERLLQARTNAGMTMTQLHLNVFISQTSLSRYERGLMLPTTDRLFDLANLYGCSIDWLCGLKEEQV